MIEIVTLRIGSDNYSYLVRYGPTDCLVVDPGSAGPVASALDQRRWRLSHILCTHGHADHTAGADALVRRYGARLVGPRTPLPDDRLARPGLTARRIATPGHSPDSVCYLVTDPNCPGHSGNLFSGDTLFVAGCGRAFDSMRALFESLNRLAALPDETRIWPGHDYTEENYRFALTIEPNNRHVQTALDDLPACMSDAPHVPSTLAKEKQTNPFLRASDLAIFTARRRAKDRF